MTSLGLASHPQPPLSCTWEIPCITDCLYTPHVRTYCAANSAVATQDTVLLAP